MLETLFDMSPAIFLSFTGAGILLNLTPGTDVVFAMACGVSGGPRTGIAAALGITCGSFFHLTLAVLGISAAITTIPYAFDAIRYLGAGYLAWLAFKSWTAKSEFGQTKGTTSLGRAFRRGFWTNVLNPKVALFILAFLPQFTDPSIGPVWPQMVVLGIIFMSTGFIITATYGALAGVLSDRLCAANATMNKITAIVFGGLAAKLVFD